ncbi:protein O-mannosyl-transferase TMTC1-like [Aphis craccivora]|uniref:Protein O-mannosyl-transferase TMTC1-like n=1 Tax=Aphis craccivora TaxID=307492 RepID=A0A6G0ZPB1_APHCR|nr:protein O-mannosyl-transferase TMTC1-like [Aphis craccivora]
MLCPSALSHDWQMNSLPLVTSLDDIRNIGTFVAAAFLLCTTCKILSDIDVSYTCIFYITLYLYVCFSKYFF